MYKLNVSIHAPARGATTRRRRGCRCVVFQSTRPRGARQLSNIFIPPVERFNPRARAGRDRNVPVFGRKFMFQSTRPRGARQLSIHRDIRSSCVSIHAPARGATVLQSQFHIHARVSIHAPARGATARMQTNLRFGKFQSTRPRGARRRSYHSSVRKLVFQSTRPRGARPLHFEIQSFGIISFNPRARAGRDFDLTARYPNQYSFNPRARAGRDDYPVGKRHRRVVSIHAPARGATE